MKLEVLAISTSIPAGLFLLAMLIGTWQLCWAWTLLGAVLLDTCCLRLKEVIRQARPIDPAPAFVLESEGLYGMPSEHAAFVTYLFVHLGMRLSRSDWDRLAKSMACLALATWGAALVTTRYVYGAILCPNFWLVEASVSLQEDVGPTWRQNFTGPFSSGRTSSTHLEFASKVCTALRILKTENMAPPYQKLRSRMCKSRTHWTVFFGTCAIYEPWSFMFATGIFETSAVRSK